MVQKYLTDKMGSSRKNYRNRSVHKVHLEDLQQYFDHNIFYFSEYNDSEDYDEALTRQYEEQVTDFIRSIGAMASVEEFFKISGTNIIYVRKVPPGIRPVKA